MKKLSYENMIDDLEKNHDNSWFTELYNRNKNNLNDVALIYRGTKITYKELFFKMESYAKSLKKMGLGVDSEIPVCLSNSPEIVYIMGAASMIGAKLNIFGSHFPLEYITEILNGCNSGVLFVEDNNYEIIKEATEKSNTKKIIMNSLSDSLKYGLNPYLEFEKKPQKFESKVEIFKSSDSRIISQEEYLDFGEDYNGKLYENVGRNQDFVITYTSGSTNEDRPKAIVHSSKNFIYVARFHDKDFNGINTKSFTSLAHIPTYSNTNLVSSISDSLMQGAKLALEPCYDKDFFIISLLINKPNYVAATKSFWVNVAKKVLFDPTYSNAKFENLVLGFSAGEPLEINEEKLINKALKKAKAGTKFTHTPFSIIKISEAGGDCEHGSIFYCIFRSYMNFTTAGKKGESVGLTSFPFVELAVLDENGNKLGENKLGKIVANSPCTMKNYKNNDEANENFFIHDSEGKEWADMKLYGYIDSNKKVHIYGRMVNDCIIHPSLIAKQILKDTKNILSCEVIIDYEKNCYVANVEMMPDARHGVAYTMYSAFKRCENICKTYGIDIYFNVINNNDSFLLTKSGKRDVKKLFSTGLTEECFKPTFENGEYGFDYCILNNKGYQRKK